MSTPGSRSARASAAATATSATATCATSATARPTARCRGKANQQDNHELAAGDNALHPSSARLSYPDWPTGGQSVYDDSVGGYRNPHGPSLRPPAGPSFAIGCKKVVLSGFRR